MNPMPNDQNVMPSLDNVPMAAYPTEKLEDMYPEVYHCVYPKVKNLCAMMDVPGNPEMYPNPTRAAVERMTDQIYKMSCDDLGYAEENVEYEKMEKGQRQPFGFYGGGPFFGGRRFLRDLAGILLIRELLGRRRIPYYPYSPYFPYSPYPPYPYLY